MKRVFLSMFFIMLIFSNINIVFAMDIDELAEHINDKYEKIEDLKADFIQIQYIAMLDDDMESSGQLKLKKPNKILLAYDPPVEALTISNGTIMWMYVPANEQVLQSKVRDDNDPAMFINGMIFNYNTDYNAKFLDDENIDKFACYHLEMYPKEENGYFERLEIWVDKEEYLTRKILVETPDGTTIKYILQNIEINTNIGDEVFEFEVPKGVEVINIDE